MTGMDEGRRVERWDAGDLGCGPLALGIKDRLDRLRPGDRLEVVATGPGARAEIPSWCRLSGLTLVAAEHPKYLIEKT